MANHDAASVTAAGCREIIHHWVQGTKDVKLASFYCGTTCYQNVVRRTYICSCSLDKNTRSLTSLWKVALGPLPPPPTRQPCDQVTKYEMNDKAARVKLRKHFHLISNFCILETQVRDSDENKEISSVVPLAQCAPPIASSRCDMTRSAVYMVRGNILFRSVHFFSSHLCLRKLLCLFRGARARHPVLNSQPLSPSPLGRLEFVFCRLE